MRRSGFIPFGQGLLLQATLEGRWQPLYDISPEPQIPIDYELANWFTSKHPASHFRQILMVAKTTPAARFNLLDNRLTIRAPDGKLERGTLDAGALEAVLGEVFALAVEPDWRPLIARLAAAHP